MSHLLEEDSDTRSSEMDDLENDCESIETDSLHLEEMEEDENSAIGIACNPSERVIGGSIILQIDQTEHSRGLDSLNHSFGLPILQTPFGNMTHPNNNGSCGDAHASPDNNLPTLPEDEQGQQNITSTGTSLSEAASDNMSTRAVMGDTPSIVNTIPEEDDVDNSSQASMADSDAERVRRIHNSIFRGLEHDLAELVRIREETIQFSENGAQDNNTNENTGFDDETFSSNENGDLLICSNQSNFHINNNSAEEITASPSFHTTTTTTENRSEPVVIRERLTFPTSPYRTTDLKGSQSKVAKNAVPDKNPNTLTFDGYSYTPIAKFDNAPPAKPGKPYVEVGLMNCDEKAAAARKIFDKLQYGDPEDESACFVRRFWRETSTVVENTTQEDQLPVTVDAATLAQRSASLQATLEEAFGGLRLRLQQAQAEASGNLQSIQSENIANPGEDGTRSGGESETNQPTTCGESRVGNSSTSNNQNPEASQSLAYYQSWDEETSILNNPLNYDIWNELENDNDVGSTITARINLAERRANTSRTGSNSRSLLNRSIPNMSNSLVHTSTVAVGTDEGSSAHDGDVDDEVDEEISSYFRCHMSNNMAHSRGRCEQGNESNLGLERDFSPSTMDFFDDIGITEQLGRDIFDMLSISDEEIPPLIPGTAENTTQNTPEPLYRRRLPNSDNGNEGELNEEDYEDDDDFHLDFPCMDSGSDGDEEDEEDGQSNSVIPRVPLADATSGSGCSLFAPNREDDCSTRVYFDENYLNFSHASRESQEEQDDEDTP